MPNTSSIPLLHVRYLILGAGLTGLSTAYHLEKQKITDYLVVEQHNFLGGLCASQIKQGFTFDYAGHLLHLQDPYTLRLVRRLLSGNLIRHHRRAFVEFGGRLVPFPFQANLWALPADIRRQCIEGLAQTSRKHPYAAANFEQWCLQQFGPGIYQHFLKPYNQKLWQIPLTQLSAEWCPSFVPMPNAQQMAATSRRSKQTWGYNAVFYYPKRGGIEALAEALARTVPNIWLQAPLQKIDLKNKRAYIQGRCVQYEKLVNTLPLKDFMAVCTPSLPVAVRQAAHRLTATTIHVWNIAIKRKMTPFHWIYFAQPQVPFYRVGMQSAFSPYNAPAGTTSFYIETAEATAPSKSTEKAILKSLCQKGIIREQEELLCSFWNTLTPAYALYDKHRSHAVDYLLRWLQQRDCFCGGRYGRWEYSFMERSLLQGKQLAAQLLNTSL